MTMAGIIQSNYVPWRGYFDFIAQVDAFVLLDDVQYTRRDWRNRNVIKTDRGLRWLTIPVESKGRYEQRIDEVVIANEGWIEEHLSTIRHAYSRAECFDETWPWLAQTYRSLRGVSRLTDVNERLIRAICEVLEITTPISRSSDYPTKPGKNERLIDICLALGAKGYLSGPAAASYVDQRLWNEAGIEVSFKRYEGYREYPQLHGPFEANVSIVDLLFNVGRMSKEFVRPSR